MRFSLCCHGLFAFQRQDIEEGISNKESELRKVCSLGISALGTTLLTLNSSRDREQINVLRREHLSCLTFISQLIFHKENRNTTLNYLLRYLLPKISLSRHQSMHVCVNTHVNI